MNQKSLPWVGGGKTRLVIDTMVRFNNDISEDGELKWKEVWKICPRKTLSCPVTECLTGQFVSMRVILNKISVNTVSAVSCLGHYGTKKVTIAS